MAATGQGGSPECGEVPDGNADWEIREQEGSRSTSWQVPPEVIDQACFDALSEEKKEALRMLYSSENLPEDATDIGELQIKEEGSRTSFRIVRSDD